MNNHVLAKQKRIDYLEIKTLNYNTPPFGQITLSKLDEICPLAIPNQYQCTYQVWWKSVHVYSSGNEKQVDWRTTDGRMDRHMHVRRETIIPHHYLLAGYKNDYFLYNLYICAWIQYFWIQYFKSSYIQNCLITNHLIKQFQHTVQHQRIWSDGANIHADLGLHCRHAFQRHKAWLICSVVCDKLLFLQQKDFSCTLLFFFFGN